MIAVHSATKYIGGHGRRHRRRPLTAASSTGACSVDGVDLFPGFTTPDHSYGGVVIADLGAPAYALKAYSSVRDTGSADKLFNAFRPRASRPEPGGRRPTPGTEEFRAADQVTSVSYAARRRRRTILCRTFPGAAPRIAEIAGGVDGAFP